MLEPVPDPPHELVRLMEQPFPAQRAFAYDADHWLEWLDAIPGARAAIEMLPAEVNRGIISEAFSELEQDNIAGAFIVVMIWGYGYAKYGPYRTLRVLSDDFRNGETLSPEVEEKLRRSITISRDQGSIAGYSYLINEGKLRKLGASFFTKWLYFATATGPQGEQATAPILDDLIIDWLKPRGVELRRSRTPHYECYVNVLTEWGKPFDLTAVDVEERIFRLIRNDST